MGLAGASSASHHPREPLAVSQFLRAQGLNLLSPYDWGQGCPLPRRPHLGSELAGSRSF